MANAGTDTFTADPSMVINISDYELKQKIGVGAQGDVSLMENKQTGELVAVKSIFTDHLEPATIKAFHREIQTMIACRGLFLVQVKGYSLTDPLCLAMEYVPNGNLYTALHGKTKPPWLDGTQKTIIALGIAHGMMVIHSHHVIHRDLKSLNILMDENNYPRICDFGYAKYKNNQISHNVPIGTPHWMAPEMFQIVDYDEKIDVYAFAMILYELVTLKIPFHEHKTPHFARLVVDKQVRPVLPSKGVPPELKTLMEKCWHQDPTQRPSFEHIFKLFAGHTVEFPDTDHDKIDRLVILAANFGKSDPAKYKILSKIDTLDFFDNLIKLSKTVIAIEDATSFFRVIRRHFHQEQREKYFAQLLSVCRLLIQDKLRCQIFIDLHMHLLLPFDKPILLDYCLDICYWLFTYYSPILPPKDFADYFASAFTQTPGRVLRLIHIYAEQFEAIPNPWPFFDRILQMSRRALKVKVYGAQYVTLFAFMCTTIPDYCRERLEGLKIKFLARLSDANVPHSLAALYCFFTRFFDPNIEIDSNLLLTHLRNKRVAPSIAAYLLVQISSNVHPRPSFMVQVSLLLRDICTRESTLVLCKYSDVLKVSLALSENLYWIGFPRPTYEDTTRILLLLMRVPEIQPKIVAEPNFCILLANLSDTMSAGTIHAITVILCCLRLTKELAKKMAECRIISRLLNIAIKLDEEDPMKEVFNVVKLFGELKFHDIPSEVVSDFLQLTDRMLIIMDRFPGHDTLYFEVIGIMSAFEECAKMMKDNGVDLQLASKQKQGNLNKRQSELVKLILDTLQ